MSAEPGRFAVRATPDDGTRLSRTMPWDEAARPEYSPPDSQRHYTATEQATAHHLVQVHDHLRAELERVRQLVDEVASGDINVGIARSMINSMTMRQNNWTLGTYCQAYCRVVTTHHMLEDASVFPHLRSSEPALAPVIDRLEQEHHVIAGVLDDVDRALVALVSTPGQLDALRQSIDTLTDTMLSHLSYEERMLLEPLARHSFY